MLGMKPADDLLAARSDDPTPTPPPRDVSGLVLRPPAEARMPDPPTPEALLRAVAEAAGPWFPAAHAKRTGTPREALEEPLAELRAAGLVQVVTWVKGVGQGYAVTPDGEKAADRSPPPAPTPTAPALATPALDGVLDLRPPLVTSCLIGVNVIWFVAAVLFALRWNIPLPAALGGGSVGVLERVGAVSAPDLLRGDWWRLVTCCFVHIGFWHLALNMIGLGMTGPVAELLWGRWRMLAIYLVGGLAGSCLAMAHHPLVLPSGVPVILAGASGAIWGLMGALLAWFLLYRSELPTDLADDWGRRLGFAFLLNAGVSLLPQVSWEAHLGGGVAGFLAAGLFNAVRFARGPRRLVAAGLLLLIPAGAVAGLVTAMRAGEAWALLRPRVVFAQPQPTDGRAREAAQLAEWVKPDAAKAARWGAARVWMVSADVREKARREALAEIGHLHGRVTAAAVYAADAPGPTAAGLKAAAQARLRELDRLRELATAPAMPTAEEWQSGGARRREADQFWTTAAAP
jgi:membrane associated rhomboid family serine protease